MTRIVFETETCTRCGGTGTMPFPEVHHGLCFKCNGQRRCNTKAGQRAWARYQEWATATLYPALSEIVPGMRLRANRRGKYMTVLEVKPSRTTGKSRTGDGPWVEHTYTEVHFRGMVHMLVTDEAQTTLNRAPSAEELRAIVKTLGKGASLEETPSQAVA